MPRQLEFSDVCLLTVGCAIGAWILLDAERAYRWLSATNRKPISRRAFAIFRSLIALMTFSAGYALVRFAWNEFSRP